MFGPNPKYSNRYVLLGKEWNRNSGSITYQDANWYTTTESAYACLLVDLKRLVVFKEIQNCERPAC